MSVVASDEGERVGLDALATLTDLLQRSRAAHPTTGLFEAADFQWWWRVERATDAVPQLFWFDGDGRPEAAVILTAWTDRVALDPIVLPGASREMVEYVTDRGLVHAAEHGFPSVGLEVADDDQVLLDILDERGFTVGDVGVVESWLDADARPPVSSLHDGYRLTTRADSLGRPHHMISERRGHPDPEPRLRQTSLYRADLDLVVFDASDAVAAYGLFWIDPVTATGLVEPMRTEDEHQRRGLARHVLTAGVDLLARAGARRIKICFEPDNPGSSTLYVDAGFRPVKQTHLVTR